MKVFLLFLSVIFSVGTLDAQKTHEPFSSPEKQIPSRQNAVFNRMAKSEFRQIEQISKNIAPVAPKKSAAQKHLKEIEFIWNDEEQPAGWHYTGTTLLERAANGNVTSKLLTDTVNDVTISKMDYFQDQFGNDTLIITSSWDPSEESFEQVSKELFFFDPQDNEMMGQVYYVSVEGGWMIINGWKTINVFDGNLLIQTTDYSWDLMSNKWVADWRSIYEYNGSNVIKETIQEKPGGFFPKKSVLQGARINNSMEQYDDSQLVNSEMYEYEYDGSLISSATDYVWDEDKWIPTSKYMNIIWNDLNNYQPESYDLYNYDPLSEEFNLTERYESDITENSTESRWYYYDAIGEQFILDEKYLQETLLNDGMRYTEYIETESGVFTPSDRITISYDEKGNQLGVWQESYDPGEDLWILEDASRNEYIYDGSDLLVQLITSYYEVGVWVNISRTDFLNYGTFAVSTRAHQVESLLAYPNPTDGLLTIKTGNPFTNSLIQVYDLTGQKILEKMASGDQVTINLSGLNKGLYLIRVENETIVVSLR